MEEREMRYATPKSRKPDGDVPEASQEVMVDEATEAAKEAEDADDKADEKREWAAESAPAEWWSLTMEVARTYEATGAAA